MDHYQTLGVAKNATPNELKKAYRRLASIHHPDKGGDTATFQKIQVAYDTLSDPQKRQQYDNPQPQGFGEGFPGGFHFNQQGFDLNDLFGQMFGQRQRSSHPTYKTDVWVSLEQIYGNEEQLLQLNINNVNKAVKVDIPQGVENGQQVRYENIIPNASLIVEFRVKPHTRFERRGLNLYATHRINVFDLIVGSNFEFITIGGKTLSVTVNPKTQPGSMLRVAGQGLSRGTLIGDQMILLEAFIPDTIHNTITDSILANK